MPVSNNDERFESSCIDGLLVNPIPVRDFRPLSREEIYNRSDESIANRDCISASWPTGQMYSLYAVAVGKRKEETRSLELPNRTQAFIQSTKLTGYLLSETHSVGRSKARFFRSLGFNEDTVSLLEQELLAIARSQEVTETLSTAHGMKYVITGTINTPVGKTVSILTVWIIDEGEDNPRFVTARPFRDQKDGLES